MRSMGAARMPTERRSGHDRNVGTLHTAQGAAEDKALSSLCRARGSWVTHRVVPRSGGSRLRNWIERRLLVGIVQKLERDGADRTGLRRIRRGGAQMDLQRKEVSPNHAHSCADQFAGVWHRHAGAWV